jgi:hypothetical protein
MEGDVSTMPDCEMPSIITGAGCNAKAGYLVSRGRKFDAQRSCGRHLAATVTALEAGEGRPVTVEVLRERGHPGRSAIRVPGAAAAIAAVFDEVDL